MLIKFCNRCIGNPYTTDVQMSICPLCGSSLQMASVSETELHGREQLPIGDQNVPDENHNGWIPEEEETTYVDEHPSHIGVASSRNANGNRRCIVGRVSQYKISSEKNGYRRLFPMKLFQAVVYGQRLEDVLHSFTLTDDRGESYVVNVHGTTNIGATIVDHEKVEVTGAFDHNNIFLARTVAVLNESRATPVKFQRSIKATLVLFVTALLFLFGIFGLIGSGGSLSGTLNSVWSFVTTMFAVYVCLLILYIVASFTRVGFMIRLLGGRNRKSLPLVTMLIVAFFLTLLLYNSFGIGSAIGSALASVLSSVGPIIIMIFAIVLLFKALK